MKHGKIVLSAAALIVTVASSLAFKVQHKFNNRLQLFTNPGTCHAVSCYTVAAGGTGNNCSAGVTYYTANNCSNVYSGVKTSTF